MVKYFVLLLGHTLNFRIHTEPPKERCIYIFWHRNIIPLLYLHRNQKIAIIISASKDGELIAAPAELLGYTAIRGSSSRGGTAALLKSFKLSEEHTIAITPDGPRGPRERLKKSILFIAYHTGLPIVPVAVNIDREWVLRSWDNFRIPKPKSTIDITYGDPIMVRDKEEIDTMLPYLQREMDRLQAENREIKLQK